MADSTCRRTSVLRTTRARALIVLLSGVIAGGASAPALAQIVFVLAGVERTLLADGNRFGGCMAKLKVALRDKGLDCSGSWVTFSCSGDFNSPDIAFRMFDTAQIAQLTGNEVSLYVDDTKKHNNNCYANSIFLLTPPAP